LRNVSDGRGVAYPRNIDPLRRFRRIASIRNPTRLTGRTTVPILQNTRKLDAMGPPSPWKLPPDTTKRIRLRTHVKKDRKVRANQRFRSNSLTIALNAKSCTRHRKPKNDTNSTV